MRSLNKIVLISHFCFSVIITICLTSFASCLGQTAVNRAEIEVNVTEENLRAGGSSNEESPINDALNGHFLKKAHEIASSMDNRLLTAQIIISGIDGRGKLASDTKALLKGTPAGGIMFFSHNLNTDNNSIRLFISETISAIKDETNIPPFITVDHEGGIVFRFGRGVSNLPGAYTYWEKSQKDGRLAVLEKIEEDSLKSGREIKALGFNMNFAPVVEYIVDENRRFLSGRSYGPDPVFTAQAASAFFHGMEKSGILCVIKHFPGNAGQDPHISASVINADKSTLDKYIYPFTVLINLGARAVMVAHTSVPAVDRTIATFSPVVMQNWLRGELGFDGILISDDLVMAAVGKIPPEEAAVRSVAAGMDMVLIWPKDLKRTHNALLAALENGRLPKERLLEAVKRILYEKLRMGLIE